MNSIIFLLLLIQSVVVVVVASNVEVSSFIDASESIERTNRNNEDSSYMSTEEGSSTSTRRITSTIDTETESRTTGLGGGGGGVRKTTVVKEEAQEVTVTEESAAKQSCASAQTCEECSKSSYHLFFSSNSKYLCDFDNDTNECLLEEGKGKGKELKCPGVVGGVSSASYIGVNEVNIMGQLLHTLILVGFMGGILYTRRRVLRMHRNASGGGSNGNSRVLNEEEEGWGRNGVGSNQLNSVGRNLARNSEIITKRGHARGNRS